MEDISAPNQVQNNTGLGFITHQDTIIQNRGSNNGLGFINHQDTILDGSLSNNRQSLENKSKTPGRASGAQLGLIEH